MGKSVTRLYEQFQPDNYQLELHLDDEAMTFKGTVTIRGKKVGRPSQRLTFHQKELKITGATVRKQDKKGDQEIRIARINNQNGFDEVRLHADEMIYPGNYTVILEFEGRITRPMNGIYPCFFKQDGADKHLIATQFESHHAREAFPCIDEPEAKATFDLALVTPASQSKAVLANTPARTVMPEGDVVTTVFHTTPKMSTYLLAFVYGDMEYLEAKTRDGVVVRTYATPDNVQFTQFALDCAVKTLEYYNEYFDIPYPLPKCDFIALPDFASGAMENWGCITFREQALLVDPQNTSLHLKQYVANVVAHELTHQWFGNLVTMRWWTDLWLNESFASWMSYLAVNHLFPEWEVWTQFIVEEQSYALKLDALEHTHPIQAEINHPDEIRTIFDAISYEKGASVLLMLNRVLGNDNFREGLRLYLKKHAYGNTESTDLWAAWEEVSGHPVTDFMTAWTGQSGYPILSAEIDVDKPILKQERFYLNPKAKKETTVWPVPLETNLPIGINYLSKASEAVAVENISGAGSSLMFNHLRTGFFRVIYDPAHLEKLAGLIEKGIITEEVDRLGLLSDAFEAAKAGYGSTVDALKLLEAYKNEDSTVVWDIIAGGIGSIRTVMDDEDIRKYLKPVIRQLTAKQFDRLGWEESDKDSHFDRLLRPTILGLASFGEEPRVVDEALKRFKEMEKPEDVHPDLRGVVYGTAARKGAKNAFEKMVAMHNQSKNSEERVTLSGSITAFKDPVLVQRALAMITSEHVRLQDAPYWIAYSFMNRHARSASWAWLKENWQWLQKNIGSDLSFYRMPIYAGRCYSDKAFLPEFREFFESHMSEAFVRPVNQAIETIEWQAAWKERDMAAIKDYLKSK
jgi:aminopeptidase N